jgi:hypothetical protein
MSIYVAPHYSFYIEIHADQEKYNCTVAFVSYIYYLALEGTYKSISVTLLHYFHIYCFASLFYIGTITKMILGYTTIYLQRRDKIVPVSKDA